MWINAADDGFAVTAVAPGSPAAEAGLEAGDVITSVNGERAVPEHLSDARSLLRALPAGSKVPLTAERGTRLLNVTLSLRDLI
jgi:S1-C subfamily serine protease